MPKVSRYPGEVRRPDSLMITIVVDFHQILGRGVKNLHCLAVIDCQQTLVITINTNSTTANSFDSERWQATHTSAICIYNEDANVINELTLYAIIIRL